MDRRTIKNYIKFTLINHRKKIIFEKPVKFNGSEYIKIGKYVKIRSNSRIECFDKFAGIKMNPSLYIGDRVIINNNFFCYVTDELRIEKNVIIAANVLITTENHGINPEIDIPYANQPLESKKVFIDENVWIGQNAVILPGINIGKGAIIGAGAIVTKNVLPYTMVAGNPARVIKEYDFEKHEWVKSRKE